MESEKDGSETDKARRRKSEVAGMFTNFINRSASSLTRSKSQDGKARRSEVRVVEEQPKSLSRSTGMFTTAHPSSRLPVFSSSTGTYQNPVSSSIYSHGTVASPRSSTSHPRPISSTPSSPTRADRTPTRSRTSTSPSSPRTARAQSPPSATRALSRIPQAHTSPTIVQRQISSGNAFSPPPSSCGSRPTTPSASSSKGKRVFSILMSPSTSARKSAASVDLGRGDRKQQARSGSGSSNEPLLPTVSRSSSSDQHHDQGVASRPAPLSVINSVAESQASIMNERASTPRRHHDAVDPNRTPKPKQHGYQQHHHQQQTFPTESRGKHRDVTPPQHIENAARPIVTLASPQARAPATFLPQPIPRLHRTPPTPQKRKDVEKDAMFLPKGRSQASPRVDSFMSDSMPVPTPQDLGRLSPPNPDVTPLSRHPAFACPTIERSKSAPARDRQYKGRTSPCLRIPSPKIFGGGNRDKEGRVKERKVTPESVGSPIVRDTRALPGEKQSAMARISQKVRRTTHGSFDFERPGSRGSSKSAYSESKSAKSDEEKDADKPQMKEKSSNRFSLIGRPKKTPAAKDVHKSVKHKASSPVPPLPTHVISARTTARSPPPRPRTRSPQYNGVSVVSSEDDSALPRLSSSAARRATIRTSQKLHSAHPSFAFERPPGADRILQEVSRKSHSSVAGKSSVRSGGPFVDTQTGLMWRRSNMKENVIMEESRVAHRKSVRDGRISPRAMEEATAVIAALRDALNDVGFSRLQTYVTRFDAQIIPLDGPLGLIARVQRLLETSATMSDERRKQQLLDTFIRVVSEGS